jgi:hypothetical protein
VTKLFHQCGHYSNWNIDSFTDDGCGDGLILSPVHMDKKAVSRLDDKIKHNALFDPQFYLPSSRKAKLSSYEFFPETITGGFSTQEFSLVALKAAKACIAFQVECGFQKLVIPTRYIDQMLSDFVDRQNAYTVHPFLEVIHEMKPKAPVYLSLVMTSHMIKDRKYRTDILNWISSIPELAGIYLIPDCERTTKQIDDAETLIGLRALVSEIRRTGLEVLVGYLNTESLLLAVADDIGVTCGGFENTRIFSVDKFLESDDDRRGPKARIYLSGLFNWVQINQARQIRLQMPTVWKEIYSPSEESEKALAAPVDPTFNQAPLYKHHFKTISAQIASLNALDPGARKKALSDQVVKASGLYREIKARVEIEKHGSDAHLSAWQAALT